MNAVKYQRYAAFREAVVLSLHKIFFFVKMVIHLSLIEHFNIEYPLKNDTKCVNGTTYYKNYVNIYSETNYTILNDTVSPKYEAYDRSETRFHRCYIRPDTSINIQNGNLILLLTYIYLYIFFQIDKF